MVDVVINADVVLNEAAIVAKGNAAVRAAEKAITPVRIKAIVEGIEVNEAQAKAAAARAYKTVQAASQQAQRYTQTFSNSYFNNQTSMLDKMIGADPASIARAKSLLSSIQTQIQAFTDSSGKPMSATKAQIDTLVTSLQSYSKELGVIRSENSAFLADQKSGKQLANLWQEAQAYMTKYSTALSRLNNKGVAEQGAVITDKISSAYASLTSGNKISPQRLAELTTEWTKFTAACETAGVTTEKTGERIGRVFGKQFQSVAIMLAIALIRKAIVGMFNNVKDINSALAQLRIVTGETESRLVSFGNEASSVAKKIASSVTGVLSASETYARLGYSLEDALTLAEATNIYANIADVEVSDATDSITAIMKGFNIEASSVTRVTDVLSYIGAKYAVSAGELGTALQTAGATLEAGGNSLEQSVALVAAGNAAIQDASRVGTALKTSSMRIRGATADLEDAGEEIDDFVTSTSKMRETIMGVSGVDIMLDENTFKSTYDILVEIANVWDQLTDVNQATLLEALAGKRNASVIKSVITNVNDLTGAYKDATEAADGYAATSQSIYKDSIEGRIGVLKATAETFSQSFLNSESVKGAVSALSTLLEWITKVTDGIGGLGTAMIALTIVNFVKHIGSMRVAFQNAATAVETTNSAMRGMKAALASNPIGWIMLALSVVISIFGAVKQAQQEAEAAVSASVDAGKQAASDLESNKSSLSSYAGEVRDLRGVLADSTSSFQELYDARARLVEIQSTLISKYGAEAAGLNLVTGAIEDQTSAIEGLGQVEYENFTDENKTAIAKAQDYFTDGKYKKLTALQKVWSSVTPGWATPNIDTDPFLARQNLQWDARYIGVKPTSESDYAILAKYGVGYHGEGQYAGNPVDLENMLREWIDVAESDGSSSDAIQRMSDALSKLVIERDKYQSTWDTYVEGYMAYESGKRADYSNALEAWTDMASAENVEDRLAAAIRFSSIVGRNIDNGNDMENYAFSGLQDSAPWMDFIQSYNNKSTPLTKQLVGDLSGAYESGDYEQAQKIADRLSQQFGLTEDSLLSLLESFGLIPDLAVSTIPTLVDNVLDVESALDGATAAKDRFDAAMEKADVDDSFKNYAEIYKTYKEYYDKGYFGSTKYKAAVTELLGEGYLESIDYDWERAGKEIAGSNFLTQAFAANGEDAGYGAIDALRQYYADAEGVIKDGEATLAHFSTDEYGQDTFTIDDFAAFSSYLGVSEDILRSLMSAAGITTGAVETSAVDAIALLDKLGEGISKVDAVTGNVEINMSKFVDALLGKGESVEDINAVIDALDQLDGYTFTDQIESVAAYADAWEKAKDGSEGAAVDESGFRKYTESVKPDDATTEVVFDSTAAESNVKGYVQDLDSIPTTVTTTAIFNNPYFKHHAAGTQNAPGGPSLVNDGKDGPELIVDKQGAYIANGGSPAVVNLSRGATVYTGTETRQILQGGKLRTVIPAYRNGVGLRGLRLDQDTATVHITKQSGSGSGSGSGDSSTFDSDIEALEYLLELYESLLNYYEEGSEKWIDRQTEIIAKYQAAAEITQREYDRLLAAGVEATDEDMMDISRSLLEYQEDVFNSSKELWDAIRQNHIDELQYQKDINSAVIDLTDAHHGLKKAIEDERRELESELKSARDAYSEVLTPSELNAMFNADDYADLMSQLDSLAAEAEDMYADYYATIQSIGEDEQEKTQFITDEFQRQYELKMKEYEVAKAELAVRRAEIALQNTQNERNVAMLIGGKWTWVADPEAVLDAEETLSDSMQDLADAEDEKQYKTTVAALETTNSTLQLQIDALEKLVFTMDNLATEIHTLVNTIQDNVLAILSDYATARITSQEVAVPAFATGGVIKSGGLAHVDNGELLFNSEDASTLYKLIHNGGLDGDASVAMQSMRMRTMDVEAVNGSVTHDNRVYINGLNVAGNDANQLIEVLSRIVPRWQPT